MPLIIPLSILFWTSILTPTSVHADAAYTIAPLVIDIDAEARDILTKQITITNTGSQPVTIYPTVNNISLTAGGTIEEFLPPVMSDRTASLASWLEISRAGIDIPIGGIRSVDLTIRINPNPVPGDYHAFIGFGYGGNRDEAEAQVALGRAPGTIISVTIDDKKKEFLKLSRFIIDRFITGTANQAALYTIKNPGDEPLKPVGEIILYDKRGSEVGNLPVNVEGVTIPPGEERQFTASVPVDGLFGKYKAFLSVEYGSAQLASMQDTAFFYVFPLKNILIGLGIVSVLVVLIALYLHRKYFNDAFVDGSDMLPLHVRETRSEAKHHDIDLSKL